MQYKTNLQQSLATHGSPATVASRARDHNQRKWLALHACAALFLLGGSAADTSAIAAPAPERANAKATADTAPGASPASSSDSASAGPSALSMPDVSRYRADLDEMQRLRRNNEVLRLRLENQKLETGLAKLSPNPIGADVADDADSLRGAMTHWIGGRGEVARAQVWLPGQGSVQVGVGERLSNGWQVARISADGVVLQRRGRRYVLPFGDARSPAAPGPQS